MSVIVPVYDGGDRLRRCLDSLVAQTLRDIEIIGVDDGSTDGSGAVLDEYAGRDGRVRVFHQDNRGLSSARNRALAAATGRYVMFCDADDYADGDWCERLYRAVDSSGAECGVCDVRCEGGRFSRRREMQRYFSRRGNGRCRVSERLLLAVDVCVWDKIYRRDLIEENGIGFFEGLGHEDDFFFWDYMRFARNVTFVRRVRYHYCLRDGGLTGRERESGAALDYLTGSLTLIRRLSAAPDHRRVFVRGMLANVIHVFGLLPERLHDNGLALAGRLAEEIGKTVDAGRLTKRERRILEAMRARDPLLVPRTRTLFGGLVSVRDNVCRRIVRIAGMPVAVFGRKSGREGRDEER